jgi:hypothetical protein
MASAIRAPISASAFAEIVATWSISLFPYEQECTGGSLAIQSRAIFV